VGNGWNEREITVSGDQRRWTNRAGASGDLRLDMDSEVLSTGSDHPCYEHGHTRFLLFRGEREDGSPLPGFRGLRFASEDLLKR